MKFHLEIRAWDSWIVPKGHRYEHQNLPDKLKNRAALNMTVLEMPHGHFVGQTWQNTYGTLKEHLKTGRIITGRSIIP